MFLFQEQLGKKSKNHPFAGNSSTPNHPRFFHGQTHTNHPKKHQPNTHPTQAFVGAKGTQEAEWQEDQGRPGVQNPTSRWNSPDWVKDWEKQFTVGHRGWCFFFAKTTVKFVGIHAFFIFMFHEFIHWCILPASQQEVGSFCGNP